MKVKSEYPGKLSTEDRGSLIPRFSLSAATDIPHIKGAVAFAQYKPHALYIQKSVNNHADLVDALRKLLYWCDTIRATDELTEDRKAAKKLLVKVLGEQ